MTFGAQTISSPQGSHRRRRRLGRGNGSTKGTYAGRGMKGQRARSGGKGGLQRLGFKPGLQQVPKSRGFQSHIPKEETVTLALLEKFFAEGDIVTPKALAKKGIVDHPQKGVKIVAKGNLTKKLTVQYCKASVQAAAGIEKAGGSFLRS